MNHEYQCLNISTLNNSFISFLFKISFFTDLKINKFIISKNINIKKKVGKRPT